MWHVIAPISHRLNQLSQILLPNLCQLCGNSSHDLVCQACCASWLTRQQPRCWRCAHKLESTHNQSLLICGTCLSYPPIFTRTYTLGDYAAPQDQLIWAFKFGSILPLAHFFAHHLAKLVQQSLEQLSIHSMLLVPMPLSKRRLTQRGYNQAWEVTRRLSRLCNLPTRTDALIKTRETSIQTSLSVVQRQRNLRGSLMAHSCVKGLHIALIDDVMTSGITLNEAARALLCTGALSVSNYVLLRTPKH